MIKIIKLSKEEPYSIFKDYYDSAMDAKQESVEVISISSFNVKQNEVESRFVNLKYIINDEWTFFSNYKSPKALQFQGHDQISVLFYWKEINTQIRLKCNIYKSPDNFSDQHFQGRTKEKNALAISSSQSEVVQSYRDVEDSYNMTLANISESEERPDYWGGFSFIPYYFEFWQGHNNRLNKRHVFFKDNEVWKDTYLQP